MKNILLGTTVLGAAALFAGVAHAETPKVTLGGYADFQAGFVGEDNDANKRSGAFRSDDVITFRIDGKSDAGLGYGAAVDLHADVSGDTDNAKDAEGTARRTYIYVDGGWGRVQAGSDLGVTNTMKIGAESIAHGTGGIDGDWTYFVSPTSGNVISTPDLILDHGSFGQFSDRSSENINKVSYYTPRFAGVQLGVSYLFDTTASDRGQVLSRGDSNNEAENVILGGINYEGKFSDVSVGVAATGEFGNAEVSTLNDLRTYNVGAKVGYMGFSVAGSYGDLGDSLRAKATSSDSDNDYWTLGAAYETGPFGASVTYLDSTYDNGTTHNDFSNLSFSTDYKLAPGLTPYAEVDIIKVDPTGTVDDNDATVFLLGTQVQF